MLFNLEENKKQWVDGIAYLIYSFCVLAKSIVEKHAQLNRRLDYLKGLMINKHC